MYYVEYTYKKVAIKYVCFWDEDAFDRYIHGKSMGERRACREIERLGASFCNVSYQYWEVDNCGFVSKIQTYVYPEGPSSSTIGEHDSITEAVALDKALLLPKYEYEYEVTYRVNTGMKECRVHGFNIPDALTGYANPFLMMDILEVKLIGEYDDS